MIFPQAKRSMQSNHFLHSLLTGRGRRKRVGKTTQKLPNTEGKERMDAVPLGVAKEPSKDLINLYLLWGAKKEMHYHYCHLKENAATNGKEPPCDVSI